VNKSNKYAFYGSLRKDQYNYERLKNGLEYIATVEIPGFRLYSLGPYPTALRSDDPKDTLVVDLFNVSPTITYRIDAMERGADYDYEEVEVNGEKYGIYTWDIAYGDWVKHLQTEIEEETGVN
jgi:gamma-glutamylcyclotransferase (GGCT)/AIG2-like uncharacterized protein YtfP